MALPTFVAAGAVAGGTADVVPALPTGHTTDDLLLLFVESANEPGSAPDGTWTAVDVSPQGTGAAAGASSTALEIYWKIDGGSESDPTVTDRGNHTLARILAFRGTDTTNPIHVTSGGVEATTDSTLVATGATTTVNDCLIVIASTHHLGLGGGLFSAWANADLATVTERADGGTTSGNGGGLGVATGELATAGAYGNTTATLGSGAAKGWMTLALQPPQSGAVTLTGQSQTASTGTLAPATDTALTGAAITSAQGIAIPATSIALNGQALTSAQGTAIPDISIALTGLSATFAQGTLAAGTGDVTIALTGQAITLTGGSFGPAADKALTGIAGTIAQEALSPASSLTLTGEVVTLSQGDLSAPGNVTVELTGQFISSAQGSLGPANAKALTGFSATTAAGSMAAAASVGLMGASLTASGGSLETMHVVSLAGSLATLSRGSLLITSGDPTPDALRRVTVTLSNAVTVQASHSVNVSGPPQGVTVH